MRIWVAGIHGGWSSERMTSTLRRLGVQSTLFCLSECGLQLQTGRILCNGEDIPALDAVVVRKLGDSTDSLTPYRVNLLHHLAHTGVRVFSTPRAIEQANNRYRMSLKLSQASVRMPETIVTESVDEAVRVIERWGTAVLKPLFTSKGKGMVLLDSDGPYRLALKHWQDRERFPFYLQRYVPAQSDIGVAVLGRRIWGAYQRIAAPGSWQTTTAAGGRYEPFSPTTEVADIALQAAAVFDLDYTVVDLVKHHDRYLVYEVSAFGGFSGLWACGIDAAFTLANYVLAGIGCQRDRLARS